MASSPVEPRGGDLQKELDLIDARIIHALEIFPFLSVSGLHQQVGTSVSKGIWQPRLSRLVEEGKVVKTEVSSKTPLDRNQSYTIYHLATRTYEPYNDSIHIQS